MTDGNGSQPQQQPPDPKRTGGPAPKMSRSVISWLALLGLAMLLVALLQNTMSPPASLKISEFNMLVKNQEIEELVIKDDGVIEGKRKRRNLS